MEERRLGRNGPRVSAIGFGAWAIGGNAHGNSYGSTDDEASVRAIRKAVDLGCTFFDTADVYGWGHSEELLGRALEGRRDEVVIATKVGGDFYHGGVRLNFDPDYVRFALGKSLERLRTDSIDLYQLHNPPYPAVGDAALYGVLRELHREGRIRHFGVSIHDPSEGLAAKDAAPVQTLQVVYNLAQREPEEELLPAAERDGVGIIAREPLWNGFLSGKFDGTESFDAGDIRSRWPEPYRRRRAELARSLSFLRREGRTLAQAAIAFPLRHPAVSVVIPGCKTEQQVEENLSALSVPLTDDEVRKIDALARAA